jgi:hypothetical protein
MFALTGHALDYEPFLFRVNQVLTRRNALQPKVARISSMHTYNGAHEWPCRTLNR